MTLEETTKKVIRDFKEINGEGINFSSIPDLEKHSYEDVLNDFEKTIESSKKIMKGEVKPPTIDF